LLTEHGNDLAAYLSSDPQGAKLPGFLSLLARTLAEDHAAALREVETLRQSIEHIKQIIAVQQDNARPGRVTESLDLAEIIKDALRINAAALTHCGVRVVQEFAEMAPVLADKHQVLQILVNLIRNAKDALCECTSAEKVLTIRLEASGENFVRCSVIDNGIGIPPENLTRLFEHGFTTRAKGHGFGLHSAALLAHELGGSLSVTSAGRGLGATFTLELPLHPAVPREPLS
jgi:signal transduction histidine kinase